MRLAKFEYSVDPLKNQPDHSLGDWKDGTEEKDTRINVTTAAGVRRGRQLKWMAVPHLISGSNANMLATVVSANWSRWREPRCWWRAPYH